MKNHWEVGLGKAEVFFFFFSLKKGKGEVPPWNGTLTIKRRRLR